LAGIGLSADDAMAAIAAALEAMGAQRGGGGFGIGGVDEELLELVLACMHEVAGAQLLDDAGMDAPPPMPVPRVRETAPSGPEPQPEQSPPEVQSEPQPEPEPQPEREPEREPE